MSRPAEQKSPTFPERVGRYELLIPIGTGGMATVYLARVAVVGDVYREVALKLMHPFMQEEERSSATSMVEEAKLAVRIRHPNVVPVVEVGEGPHGIFLVMDYVEGDTLSGLSRTMKKVGQRMPPPIVARIMLDALAGLHAAHELVGDQGEPLHLVHRDFSPQNILVGTDGISRLTDFGVAKAASRVNVTTSGIIKGKVSYMSPEQALGKQLDRRSDVWAAGVLTWELLAGQRLYREEDQVATILKIVREPPPLLRSVAPDVPVELERVVGEALQMNVAARTPSAAEFRKRLTEAWRANGTIADSVEVAEFVQQAARERLGARREQVAKVIKLRTSLAKVGRVAARAAADTSGPTASLAQLSEDTTSAISAASLSRLPVGAAIKADDLDPIAPRRPRRRAAWVMAGSFLAVAVILLAWVGLRSGFSGQRSSPEPSGDPVAAIPPTAPAGKPEASAPAPKVTTEAPAVLTVRANAAIKSLTINGRDALIAAPSRQLSLPLDTEDRAVRLKVVATSSDGRSAKAEAPAGATELALAFPAATRVQSGRRVKSSTKKGSAAELPGLAPTPYP